MIPGLRLKRGMERTDFELWKARDVARLLGLVEAERRYYQEIIAALPIPLAVLSADRVVVSANRAFRQTFGLRMEELRHKTIDQILPSPQLIEKIRSAHVHGMLQPYLFVDLDQRALRIAAMPIRSWDREDELETVLMVEDLSVLDRSRSATAGPVAAPDVPAILWQADAATLAFTSVSGAAEQLLGHPASLWLNSPQFFRERIHPEDRASTMAFYEGAITRTGEASAEFRAMSASGEVIWCRETILVNPPVITGVMTDISRRKQLEEQLLTAERTDALQRTAARLAHDLNNPLMIITGYGEEMLNDLKAQDPMRADVQEILTATGRIAGIAAELLDFTRRTANRPQPVDVVRIASNLEKKMAQAAGESTTVEVIVPGTPVWGLANPAQIEEVILTLISSAREGAEERTRVTISCEMETLAEQLAAATLKPGVYARIMISDNGRGMNSEKRAGVFEAALAATHPERSAGPALARAYSMVREWGGDIAFFSEPSGGSTFAVYLPYAEPEPATAPAAVETPSQPTIAPAQPPIETRETILVVEDEPGIRALIGKILQRERYNVFEARSAEDAMAAASTHAGRVDLLLTDVMLPGRGGRDLAEGMRKTMPDVKVLYISGYTADEGVRAGAFPPGSKFLQKPFTLKALVGKVREALEG